MASNWENVYVFISSTFNDMHAERDYLVKRVFPKLQEWCERRKLRLVDIDLRWGVTEEDATRNKEVVDVCLNRIDECRPFFICLLGQRYGWMPHPQDVSGETFAHFPGLERAVMDGRSVTEIEVLHALISPFHSSETLRDKGYSPAAAAFFYFRAPSYLADLPDEPAYLKRIYTDEVESDSVGKEALVDRQRRLKEQLVPATGRPIRCYQATWLKQAQTPEIEMPLKCPATLTENVERWKADWLKYADVHVSGLDIEDDPQEAVKARAFNEQLTTGRLSEFRFQDETLEECILRDLQDAITTRYPSHIEIPTDDDLQQELDQQEQFLYASSVGFVERDGDFAELDHYVESESRQPFVLTAPAGTGKTMLLANWLERHRTRTVGEPGHSVHFRFIGASDGSTSVSSLLHLILRECKEVVGKFDDEIPSDPAKLREAWPELLEKAGKHGKMVIVLDALNQLESGLSDLGWIPRQLPENVKLIVSFKRGDTESEDLYRRMSEEQWALLAECKPFADPDDRRRLVRAYLSQYLKDLDERLLESLIQSPGAENPLYLKVVLSELRVFGAFGQLEEKIRADFGDSPLSAFDAVLTRLERDPAYSPLPPGEAVPILFGLLAHGRHGFSVDELTAMLADTFELGKEEKGREDIADTIHLFLRQVRPFLTRRDGRYDFFYESFKNAALARCVKTNTEGELPKSKRTTEEWHRIIARYFGGLPLWIKQPSSMTYSGASSMASESIAQERPMLRKVAELPYHQTFGAMWSELEETLTDLEFVEAKCRSGMTYALINDCQQAVSCQPSAAIEQMLRAVVLALPALLDSPHVALQSVYNRLCWIDGLEPGLLAKLESAQATLEARGPWIRAEAKIPGSQTGSARFPLREPTVIQALSHDGQRLIVVERDRLVVTRQVPGGEIIEEKPLSRQQLAPVAICDCPGGPATINEQGGINLVQDGASLAGRANERLIAHHPRAGIIAVDSDGNLVSWHPTTDQITTLVAQLPAPLLALRISHDLNSILYVSGYNQQRIGLVRWVDGSWIPIEIAHKGAPVLDADLDTSGTRVLLTCKDRSLQVVDAQSGQPQACIRYEAVPGVIVRGMPARCALGTGASQGWAFLATHQGHLAAWNWERGHVRRLEDYRAFTEDDVWLVCFEVLQKSGELFFSTDSFGKTMSHDTTRENPRYHTTAVTDCIITDFSQIISFSQQDGTLRWYTADRLDPLTQRYHKGMTTIAKVPQSNDVVIGNSQGWVWRQPQDRDVTEREIFVPFAGAVVSLFTIDGNAVVAADATGRTQRMHLKEDRFELLNGSTGAERQKAIFPANNKGLYWSLYETAQGDHAEGLTLVTGVDHREAVFRSRHVIKSAAVTADGTKVCLASDKVRILHHLENSWTEEWARATPVTLVAFLEEDEKLAVVLSEKRWLEVWRLVDGLPTVAAVELPGMATCLSTRGDRIAIGFSSGDVMSLRLRSRG